MRLFLVCASILACCLCSVGFSEPDKPTDAPRSIVHDSGPVQGMWIEDQRATMALVTRKDDVPKAFQDTLPYVCVYVKDASGKQGTLPYALNLQGGELTLQIPQEKGNPKIVPMRRVVALIEAAEQLHNQAK